MVLRIGNKGVKDGRNLNTPTQNLFVIFKLIFQFFLNPKIDLLEF